VGKTVHRCRASVLPAPAASSGSSSSSMANTTYASRATSITAPQLANVRTALPAPGTAVWLHEEGMTGSTDGAPHHVAKSRCQDNLSKTVQDSPHTNQHYLQTTATGLQQWQVAFYKRCRRPCRSDLQQRPAMRGDTVQEGCCYSQQTTLSLQDTSRCGVCSTGSSTAQCKSTGSSSSSSSSKIC